ncbi:hypothetical protein ABMA27_002592 [Loxostege sticticalis]|uniref:Uncharacterized protein n=1 Tax=Loxostege sticticalis TaxID=481309 RepID=A0ABR3HU75_LOXSC
MSLTKLIKAPIKLFKKDVITFLIIRRHDLGSLEDKLRYIAVKPTASVSVLRRKVWHLLDLPDYCEEVIVLKADENKEIPLTDLRKGNNPHHPFILEVWLPEARQQSTTSMRNNMLTMGNTDSNLTTVGTCDKQDRDATGNGNTTTAISNETVELNGLRFPDKKYINLIHADYKKSEISCRISSTTMFKLNGRKNRDSFTNILLKIQSDLCTLSNKLSNLENRIPM